MEQQREARTQAENESFETDGNRNNTSAAGTFKLVGTLAESLLAIAFT